MANTDMSRLIELSSFDELIKEHGLPTKWKYQQIKKLSFAVNRFRIHANGGDTAGYVVPYDEMLELILTHSRKGGIMPLLTAGWSIVSGKRMTHLTTKSTGNWQRHYSVLRDKGRVVIAEPHDFLALKPRFSFFLDFINEFNLVFAPKHFRKIVKFLDEIKQKAKEYINKRLRDPHITKKMLNIDTEEFFLIMLDKLVHGEKSENAFAYAITNTPRSSQTSEGQGSSKEVRYEAIDTLAQTQSTGQISKDFMLDFKKLKSEFFQMILARNLDLLKQNSKNITSIKLAKKATGAEFAIFTMCLREMTDTEIHERLNRYLKPQRSRQYIGEWRKNIMLKARGLFSPLQECC